MHFPSIIAQKFGFKSLSNFWKASGEEAIHCAAAEMLQLVAQVGGSAVSELGQPGANDPPTGKQHPCLL